MEKRARYCNEFDNVMNSIEDSIAIEAADAIKKNDDVMNSIEDSIAMEAADAIKKKADIEVQLYTESDEFKLFVDRLKRKERYLNIRTPVH